MGTVLWRELLEAARRPGTWRLRWAGPLALAAVFVWARVALRPSFTGAEGLGLFNLMAKASIAFAWLVLPWTTADAIAAERREGTLGLLWLTPLTPGGVLGAKTFAHGIRAAGLLASLVPAIVFPVLMGGVGLADVARWALAWVAMAGLSMASGLVASARATGWWAVRLWALMGNVAALALLVAAWEVANGLAAWWAQGSGEPFGWLVARVRTGLQAKAVLLNQLALGHVPYALPATWGAVARMAGVAFLMLGLAAGAAAIVARGLVAGPSWEVPTRARGSRSRRWPVEHVLALGFTVAGGLLLAMTVMDGPSPEWTRDLLRPLGWLLQAVAAVIGAAAVRDMGGTPMGEMVAVTPLGLGGWARRELGRWESLLWTGWSLALMAVALAMVAAVQGHERWPWWLAPRLLMEAMTTTAGWWGALWLGAAAAWGRRPWVGVGVALGWAWMGVPMMELALRIAIEALPWTYPGGWNEPWASSRIAWQRPRIGTMALVALLQSTLMAVQAAWAGRWVLGRGRDSTFG